MNEIIPNDIFTIYNQLKLVTELQNNFEIIFIVIKYITLA